MNGHVVERARPLLSRSPQAERTGLAKAFSLNGATIAARESSIRPRGPLFRIRSRRFASSLDDGN